MTDLLHFNTNMACQKPFPAGPKGSASITHEPTQGEADLVCHTPEPYRHVTTLATIAPHAVHHPQAIKIWHLLKPSCCYCYCPQHGPPLPANQILYTPCSTQSNEDAQHRHAQTNVENCGTQADQIPAVYLGKRQNKCNNAQTTGTINHIAPSHRNRF